MATRRARSWAAREVVEVMMFLMFAAIVVGRRAQASKARRTHSSTR